MHLYVFEGIGGDYRSILVASIMQASGYCMIRGEWCVKGLVQGCADTHAYSACARKTKQFILKVLNMVNASQKTNTLPLSVDVNKTSLDSVPRYDATLGNLCVLDDTLVRQVTRFLSPRDALNLAAANRSLHNIDAIAEETLVNTGTQYIKQSLEVLKTLKLTNQQIVDTLIRMGEAAIGADQIALAQCCIRDAESKLQKMALSQGKLEQLCALFGLKVKLESLDDIPERFDAFRAQLAGSRLPRGHVQSYGQACGEVLLRYAQADRTAEAFDVLDAPRDVAARSAVKLFNQRYGADAKEKPTLRRMLAAFTPEISVQCMSNIVENQLRKGAHEQAAESALELAAFIQQQEERLGVNGAADQSPVLKRLQDRFCELVASLIRHQALLLASHILCSASATLREPALQRDGTRHLLPFSVVSVGAHARLCLAMASVGNKQEVDKLLALKPDDQELKCFALNELYVAGLKARDPKLNQQALMALRSQLMMAQGRHVGKALDAEHDIRAEWDDANFFDEIHNPLLAQFRPIYATLALALGETHVAHRLIDSVSGQDRTDLVRGIVTSMSRAGQFEHLAPIIAKVRASDQSPILGEYFRCLVADGQTHEVLKYMASFSFHLGDDHDFIAATELMLIKAGELDAARTVHEIHDRSDKVDDFSEWRIDFEEFYSMTYQPPNPSDWRQYIDWKPLVQALAEQGAYREAFERAKLVDGPMGDWALYKEQQRIVESVEDVSVAEYQQIEKKYHHFFGSSEILKNVLNVRLSNRHLEMALLTFRLGLSHLKRSDTRVTL